MKQKEFLCFCRSLQGSRAPPGCPRRKRQGLSAETAFQGERSCHPSAGSQTRGEGTGCIQTSRLERSQPDPLDLWVSGTSWRPCPASLAPPCQAQQSPGKVSPPSSLCCTPLPQGHVVTTKHMVRGTRAKGRGGLLIARAWCP